MKYDVCIVGSGAGAGPVIHELSKAGLKVVVLEKGPWLKTEDFSKDEMVATRRSIYTPNLKDECHVLVKQNKEGKWMRQSTYSSGRDFWNGSAVGGSSNFMSAYFHRLKPVDFRLKSEFGEIEGANIADWPIRYEDLEPFYTKTEELVGVSGKVVPHKHQEPRSTKDFPYPPLAENVFSTWLDGAAERLNYEIFQSPRGILSRPKDERKSCYYSNYCGSYGCSSDAKGSSRAALINDALKTGNCTILPNSKVFHLETDGNGSVVKANFYDSEGNKQFVEANTFVVAAQAVETSRLLLMSKNDEFPNGLANNSGNVGKNIVFSGGGVGSGQILFEDIDPEEAELINAPGVFVNRASQEWYVINDDAFSDNPMKGGTIDFVSEHANAVTKAIPLKWNDDGSLLFGSDLKEKMRSYFTEQRKFKFEIFVDWLPNDNCFVELDDEVIDKWGDPVAKVWLGYHEHDLKVGEYLAEKAENLFKEAGLVNVRSSISGGVSPNLQAGGCRFGNDPKTSVLDKNCKAHEVSNLYVTDGSFMPTGGSVTYTFTIYANAFRVANHLVNKLKPS
ncbi:MAG: oxidoreductase [Fluviicola sp. XM-24bin1]|nr:MAG: oxidoreductase [Fluviicola sp. XM-24bin1]